jgi:hypothetical protein
MLSDKQKTIVEQCEDVSPNDFLDSYWDKALIGYAERGGPGRFVLPAYGYQAMKALLKDQEYTPKQVYALLYKTLSAPVLGKRPLVVTKYNGDTLWKKIRNEKYPIWENLDKAIIGIGSTSFGSQGVCYLKNKCIDILQNTSSSLSDDQWRNFLDTSYKLDNTIVAASLGEKSPWFVTLIK